MRWTYDTSNDALYIYISDVSQPVIAGQVDMPDGAIIDIDEAGNALGIEVLGASAGWDVAAVVAKFHLNEFEETLTAIATSSSIMTQVSSAA